VVPAAPKLSSRANVLCMRRVVNKSFCQHCIPGQRIAGEIVPKCDQIGDAAVQLRKARAAATLEWDQMRAMDSEFDSWTYNRATGAYMNSNGHGCIGQGRVRCCW
jgi:hypothetical protein